MPRITVNYTVRRNVVDSQLSDNVRRHTVGGSVPDAAEESGRVSSSRARWNVRQPASGRRPQRHAGGPWRRRSDL